MTQADTIEYLSGFQGDFETQAIPDALPLQQNSPQQPPLGLYAEQINGSAFTVSRNNNLSSWCYRIKPSVIHGDFKLLKQNQLLTPPFDDAPQSPVQYRWNPQPMPSKPTDFIQGLFTMAGHGNPASHLGAAVHLYHANQSMHDRFFYNADGELLIVPSQGRLLILTEFGRLQLEPLEIAVIGRGIKFQVQLLDETASGYVCENFGMPFRLPELGVIGANGLAHPRHFKRPTAYYETRTGEFAIICKYQGHLWQASIPHSPFNVVAWHGNYAPYKYDLKLFNTINTVSYDHIDPSIFTVLTSPSASPGTANVDFVIFPPRWMVAEHTFRPPYYHRNIMSEFMGLLTGAYDAKPNGFAPGGCSLHNCMIGHGPDKPAYEQARSKTLKPEEYKNTMAVMFESLYAWQVSLIALKSKTRQTDYLACWQDLESTFKTP